MPKMFTADFTTHHGLVRRTFFAPDAASAYQQAHQFASVHHEHFQRASIREVEGEFERVVHSWWQVGDEYEYFECRACGHSVFNDADCRTDAHEMLKNGKNTPKRCPDCGAHMDLKTSERKKEETT